jgi:hypothetical protein
VNDEGFCGYSSRILFMHSNYSLTLNFYIGAWTRDPKSDPTTYLGGYDYIEHLEAPLTLLMIIKNIHFLPLHSNQQSCAASNLTLSPAW